MQRVTTQPKHHCPFTFLVLYKTPYQINVPRGGGIFASGPNCPLKNIAEENIIDVAEVYQLSWLEKSGQWLENIDRIHLVLASGKPVLQKSTYPVF